MTVHHGKDETERIRFIEHKGMRILLEDYSNLKPGPEFIAALGSARMAIAAQPPGSVLALVDVTGAKFDTDTVNAMGDFVKANTPYIKCSVVVGITGLLKVALMAVTKMGGRSFRTFETREEALEYLAALE